MGTDPWMVNFAYNSEGTGCAATFWLASSQVSGHKKVSPAHTIQQGTGDRWFSAYNSASKRYVALGAENNNADGCHVSGYWDEER